MTAGPIPAALVGAARSATIRVPSQSARDDDFGVQPAWGLGESSDSAM